MKAKIYMRVAKTGGSKGFKATAATRPNPKALEDSYGDALPTVAFAVLLDIPDAAFKHAEQVLAEIDIPEDRIAVAMEVS
jgi:hypothetical protein